MLTATLGCPPKVSIKCVELKEKQDQYVVRQEELKQQIADEEARAEELEELKKYVQTDSYVEEIAEEIVVKLTRDAD